MCTATKNHTLRDFDCIMVCTMLAHAFDGNIMKKLCRKYKCGGERAGLDPNFAFYTLHHECHKKESKVCDALEVMFNRNYTLIIKHIRAINIDETASIPPSVRVLFKENRAGVIWALLTDDREPLQNLGTYFVHSLLINQKTDSDIKSVSTKQEHPQELPQGNSSEIHKLTQQLHLKQEQIHSLNDKNNELRKKLALAEEKPCEVSSLERKIRKLEYSLSKSTAPYEHQERVETVPTKTLIEIDGNDSCELSCDTACSACDLNQIKVAIIGGIDRMKPRYDTIISQMGGNLLYHNGKCSGQKSIGLRSTICGADIVVFITTINSHNALHIAKAECKKSGKKFVVMRETSPNRLRQLITSEVAVANEMYS